MNERRLRDLYWAAGFLEGEGTFAYARGTRVGANQVQREPLDRLLAMFGGNIYRYNPPRYRRVHGSSGYVWMLYGIPSVGLMMTLYPLMSPRRRVQIAKALATWRTHKRARKYRTHCPHGHVYSPDNVGRGSKGERVCLTCRTRWVSAKWRRLTPEEKQSELHG